MNIKTMLMKLISLVIPIAVVILKVDLADILASRVGRDKEVVDKVEVVGLDKDKEVKAKSRWLVWPKTRRLTF